MKESLVLCIGILCIMAAVGIIMVNRYKNKRIMDSMNHMLESATKGGFSEEVYDESLLSAVELRLAQFLSATTVKTENFQVERDQVKELISDISHQTKTPVANILLYGQLLEEQDLTEEGREHVRQLNGQVEKLSFLIGSLLKASRLETGIIALNPKKEKIQMLLETVKEQLTPRALAKTIELVIEPTDLTAFYDTKWTTEAIYNIVDNGIKYTPEGGRIFIQITLYEFFVRLDIADNGMGIAENEQAKIFSRFYRSQAVSNSEGVGIGLYLTRQILSREGGYIKVQSEKGKGSTFSVFLPREEKIFQN